MTQLPASTGMWPAVFILSSLSVTGVSCQSAKPEAVRPTGSSDSSSDNTAVIAGVAVACVVVVLLIVVFFVVVCRRRRYNCSKRHAGKDSGRDRGTAMTQATPVTHVTSAQTTSGCESEDFQPEAGYQAVDIMMSNQSYVSSQPTRECESGGSHPDEPEEAAYAIPPKLIGVRIQPDEPEEGWHSNT